MTYCCQAETEYITLPPLPLTEYFPLSSSEDVKCSRLATHAHTNSLTFTKYLYLPNSKKMCENLLRLLLRLFVCSEKRPLKAGYYL